MLVHSHFYSAAALLAMTSPLIFLQRPRCRLSVSGASCITPDSALADHCARLQIIFTYLPYEIHT